MNTRTFIRMPLFLAVSLCFLGCGHMKRPPELLRLDELAKDQAAMTKAKGAAPTQFAAGQEFQKKAENAFSDDEAQPCVLYSTLALTKYNSALEQAKSKVAKERQTKATKRLDTAKKRQAEQEVRRADYDKRITRMEKILVARSTPAPWNELHEKVSDLIAVATVNNVARINECLKDIVPEYQPTPNAD